VHRHLGGGFAKLDCRCSCLPVTCVPLTSLIV
uniref:Uncharacterized protein n=1 Tax=Aegilops tauschii subsp. strangulata TaxID=200361 RepID=A0A453FV04_AEGTS